MLSLLKKAKEAMNVDRLDEETKRMIERLVVVRISTKHINLWMRQLEKKRKEICQLAMLMVLEEVKKEVATGKSHERWARCCTNHFTKRIKRMLFEEVDNMAWSGAEKSITMVSEK